MAGEAFVLELEVGPDPLAGHGSPPRDGTTRLRAALKRLWRIEGLKARVVTDSARVLLIPRPAGDAAQGQPATTADTREGQADGQ